MQKLICFLSILLFASCDPTYNIDFIINNESDHELRIINKNRLENHRDSFFLTPHSEKTILNIFGIGNTTEDRMLGVGISDLDSLEIYSITADTTYKKDWKKKENWWFILPSYGEGKGVIKLDVKNKDF